jgi:hypothetical protein
MPYATPSVPPAATPPGDADNALPVRPLDTWRVCNRQTTDEPGGGCTCPGFGPSAIVAIAAAKRLAGEL